jgi:hypothetical protein
MVCFVREISDNPPVPLMNESYEYSIKEETDYNDARTIVAATLCNRVHCFFLVY